MRILMIAPVPFMEPRGAAFQVGSRLQALSRLGHEIDLVTYPIGKDVSIPGVRIVRTWPLPGLRRVKVGPSLAKFPLDALLFLRALSLLPSRRYDCVHTHLEAGFFGALFSWLFRIPHIHDMHDDLAEQLVNSKFTHNRLLINMMRGVQSATMRTARAVIIVYPELQAVVDRFAPGKPTILIYNTSVAPDEAERTVDAADAAPALARLRSELDLPQDGGPILVYTGTFEPYQGLDLLVDGIPTVLARFSGARYVLVGGLPEQIDALRERARNLGVEHAVRFPGRRDPEEMPLFMRLSDILLSPRSEGTNTPLKLFSYLFAGRPILATNIYSHTQILTPDVSLLVEPTADALAQGTLALLADSALCEQLGRSARARAMRNYSFDAFVQQTSRAYQFLTPQLNPA